MFTPQEVSEHAFPKASFGGYNMAMVDEFLDQLTDDYTTLYKDNAALKSKMKVLVSKIEEYRSTEEAMRKALMSAQQVADNMIAEAQSRKDQLEAQAELEAKAKIEACRRQVESEEMRLETAKNATATYLSKLREMHNHQIQYIGSLEHLMPAMVSKKADMVETVSAISNNMEQITADDTADLNKTQDLGATRVMDQMDKPGGLYQDLTGFGKHADPEKDRAADMANTQRIDLGAEDNGTDIPLD